MVFSSSIFLLVFLPAVFILNRFLKTEWSNAFLLIASLIFYAWGEPVLVLLMIVSILINWSCGFAISRSTGNIRKFCLIVGIVADLCILGYYKYAGFFAKLVNSVLRNDIVPVVDIALPIGISFFTFQAMSYIIDVYRGDAEASSNLVNVALYISFFPQLIAGPIVQYTDINRQIAQRSLSWHGTATGFRRFIYGLGKKVLIANVLGLCVDTIWAYDITAVDTRAAWIASLAYTFQIYYDFSGYSDMAIGLGRMFGFGIPENFDHPYLSRSISEFWRRWHMSLGAWFRKYLYIPLGGNRKGNIRTYVNLGIVFLLTGLWHGADISFVIWGIYHGFFVIIERLGFKNLLSRSKVLSAIYAFLIVNFGWVLFRADDTVTGIQMLVRMLMPWRHSDINLNLWEYFDMRTLFIMIIAFLGMGLIQILAPIKLKEKWKGSVTEAIFCTAVLLLSIAAIAGQTYNPFIYFQF